MKKIILCSVVGVLLSNPVFSDDFSGSRLGIGYSSSQFVSNDTSEDPSFSLGMGGGVKLEYGYDFNNIVGIDISYEKNDFSTSTGDPDEDDSFDGDTLKLGADLGYAFSLKEIDGYWKPYIKLGYYSFDQKFTLDGDSGSKNKNALYYGLGFRFEYNHVYADISFDTLNVNLYTDADGEKSNDQITQTAFTIGYKF